MLTFAARSTHPPAGDTCLAIEDGCVKSLIVSMSGSSPDVAVVSFVRLLAVYRQARRIVA